MSAETLSHSDVAARSTDGLPRPTLDEVLDWDRTAPGWQPEVCYGGCRRCEERGWFTLVGYEALIDGVALCDRCYREFREGER